MGAGFVLQLSTNELAYYDASQMAEGTANSAPKWKMAINNESMSGAPVELDGLTVVAFSNGNLVVVNPETGERVKTVSVGQPIVGVPVLSNNKLLISGRDGTVHVVPMDALK